MVSIAVSGAGASTLYPTSAALIANRVPQESRGRALGIYSAIGVSVLTLGPVLAGLLTEAIDWRALFALQAAVGFALVAFGWLRVDNRPVGEPEIDPKGPATGTAKVMRGGAWNSSDASWLRPSFRYSTVPTRMTYGIGFRCAKSL